MKVNFSDVIKLRTLKCLRYPGLTRWAPKVNTSVLIRGRQRIDHREGGNVRTETKGYASGFENEGADHKPRHARNAVLDPETDKELESPLESTERTWSCLYLDSG